MNQQRLAEENIKNQQLSSRNDDPFDLGVEFVKEMTFMSHEKRLSNYIEELVSTYANYDDLSYTLNLDDLPEDEQGELARLYIEFTGRELSECVHGSDMLIDNAYTCALLAMLKDDSVSNRVKFADVVRFNIVSYYASSLQELLDEACDEYLIALEEERREQDLDD